MTVAVSAHQCHASKAYRLVRDGEYEKVRDTPKELLFVYKTARFSNIKEMFDVLRKIAKDKFACILRGVPINPSDKPQLRRTKPRKNEGFIEPPTLREDALAWAALDFDSLTMPPERHVRQMTPKEVADYALATCPPELWGISCVLQYTSSHALKPDKIRCRLWLLLSRPVMGAELRAWFHGCPVDFTVFYAHQPIYTTDPQFIRCSDPVLNRWFLISGERGEVVQVPAVFPASPQKTAKVMTAKAGAARRADPCSAWTPVERPKGWLAYLKTCGYGPGRCGFFRPITSAIGAYIAVRGPDADPEPLMRMIDLFIDLQGTGVRDNEYLDERERDARVWFDRCCDLERVKRSELIDCPCPNVPRASLAEAVAALRRALS